MTQINGYGLSFDENSENEINIFTALTAQK